MSYAIEAATKMHQRQVEAATQVQDLLISAVGGLAALRARAPHPLLRVAAPLEKATAPVAKVIGSPSEIAAYVGEARRDWNDLRVRFRDAIVDLRQGAHVTRPTVVTEPTEGPETTVVATPKAKAPVRADNS